MNRQKNTKSSIFLIELMIAVLFFALGSAVCIQVFVKAHRINEDARRLSFGSLQVSGAASALKYTDGSTEAMKEYFPLIAENDGELTVYYDRKFRQCSREESFYSMHINTEPDAAIVSARIRMDAEDSSSPIYELTLRYPVFTGTSDAERQGDRP